MINYTYFRNKSFFQNYSSIISPQSITHEKFIKLFSECSTDGYEYFTLIKNNTKIPLIMSNNLITYLIFSEEECCMDFPYNYQISMILPLDRDKFLLINEMPFNNLILNLEEGMEKIITKININTYYLFRLQTDSIIFGDKDELIRIKELFNTLL